MKRLVNMLVDFAVSLDRAKFIELFFNLLDILEQILRESRRHFFDQVLMIGIIFILQSPNVNHHSRQVIEE